MKTLVGVASLLVLVGLAPSAHGTPVTINFLGTDDPGHGVEIPNGSVFTEGVFSVTVDALAAKRNGKRKTATTDYQTGRLWQWGGPTTFGLGDCNLAERCGRKRVSGEVDNSGKRFDILRIHVDSDGTPIEAIGLSALQRNDDFAIYGSDDPFPNLFALTPLATGNGKLGRDQDILILQQFDYYFVVGKLGGRNDDFVLRHIVDTPIGNTPIVDPSIVGSAIVNASILDTPMDTLIGDTPAPRAVPAPCTLLLIATGITGLVIHRGRCSRHALAPPIACQTAPDDLARSIT